MTLVIRVPWSYGLAPWLPLLSDHFNTVGAVASLPPHVPFAVLSPLADDLIPPAQHRAVFDANHGLRKRWMPAPGSCHWCMWSQAVKNTKPISEWVEASWPQPVKECNVSEKARRVTPAAPIHCYTDPHPVR